MVLEVSRQQNDEEDAVEENRDEQRDYHETVSEDDNLDFADIMPVPRSPGGRTISTQDRLRRQGLRKSNSGDGGTNFVVQSIRRGSDDWRGLSKSQ
jgi:hypothetical protein